MLSMVLLAASSTGASAQAPAACAKQSSVSTEAGAKYMLKASSQTVHWGYFCK
jgi:hypothetical protein